MASADYYLPLTEAGRNATRYNPSRIMPGWTASRHDIWLGWRPPNPAGSIDSGWKVHISSTFDNSHKTLEIVASVCVDLAIPFKHTYDEFCFLWLHHKYGPRAQSGKFATAYPPDATAAGELMDRLYSRLADEPAPHILSDRRYRASRAIHYRYGAHREIVRFDPATGEKIRMFRDGGGALKVDERKPRFILPSGIVDPFHQPDRDMAPERPSRLFDIYSFEEAIRHSNGGGAYSAVDRRTGIRVFIKEARAYTGLTWDRLTAKDRLRREFLTLKRLSAEFPGLSPRPLDYFSEWEHEYLVTEWIEGDTLHRWVMDNMPLIRFDPDPDHSAAYYAKCRDILAQLSRCIQRMRVAGMRFGDLNPKNVMLDTSGVARLIDFEAATDLDEDPAGMGTPGYVPTGRRSDEGVDTDEYALSAVARFMIFPAFDLMQRNAGFWSAARRDAARVTSIPDDIWRAARKYSAPESCSVSEQAGDPDAEGSGNDFAVEARLWAEKLAKGILAAADPGCPHWLYPPSYQGIRSNTLCFAYGTAGVLATLALQGRHVPDALIDSLVQDCERLAGQYDSSLYFGSAGIAATLAGLDRLEEAVQILGPESDETDTLPGSLATGRTGRGLVHLDLYCRTGDPKWVAHAEAVAAMLTRAVRDGTDVLHDSTRLGLLYGHAGVALFLHGIWAVTQDKCYLDAGRALLQRDLDLRFPMDDGSISISDKVNGHRAMPYLSAGSAGVGTVALRYSRSSPAEKHLMETVHGFGRDAYKLFTYNAGLYSGLAGLVYYQNELRSQPGSSPDRTAATGRALEKYLIPSGDDYLVLGDGGTRYSADVWSGSAGIIRALDAVVHGPEYQYLPLLRGGLLVPWADAYPNAVRRR
ncbi:class III lanthionine synthetase LanKC [Nocardia sp. X0981]